MIKMIFAVTAAFVFTALLPAAPVRADHDTKHGKAGKIHYGGKPHLGYWRKGPRRGYGFGFSSYKGDPFGADDYFDGDRCHYRRGQNFCVKNRIFNGFWDLPTHR
ncbi:MAG: hypothetical protein ABL907_25150 [Hyphomicrobium sp.]